MPHAFGKKAKRMANADYAVWKRVRVAKTVAKRMGGGTFYIHPPGSFCEVRVDTGDGVTVLVKVKSARRKTKSPPRFRGIDIFMLCQAVKAFEQTYPGAHVQALAMTTWGNKFKWTVIPRSVSD